MLLRMSTLFLRTLREDPAEADAPSHRLLTRAGYLRRAASGNHTFLPLGTLVLERLTSLVRAELTATGGQEVRVPALLPADPYRVSGRFDGYGDDLFRLRDRRGAEHVLAPAHDEMVTLLVKDLCSSYRDYPVTLFRIQTTYRDEARPRGGLLRGRESLTADSYSFHLDEDGLDRSYAAHQEAYRRVLDRLGLRYTTASTGPAGDDLLVETPVGEDPFVGCDTCGHTATVEAVTTPAPPPRDLATAPPLRTHDTPDTPTIETLVAHANAHALGGRADWTAADTLKNVVLTVRAPGAATAEMLVIGVPGDREVDLRRVSAALRPATVSIFEDWADHPQLVRGYLGPQVLRKLGVRYLVDPRVVPGSAWLTGANEPGRHATGVVCGRDFTPDGTVEAAEVRAGDPCPVCGAGLVTRRGVAVGRLRKVGRWHPDAFGLDALGPDGARVPVTMGSYGVDLTRLVAVVVERHHDERGLVWPAPVAPCDVHLVPTGAAQLPAALDLAEELVARGLRVLLDDRSGVSAGVKFTDAELIGIPATVVLGRRLAEGYVEVRTRATGQRADVPLAEAPALVGSGLG